MISDVPTINISRNIKNNDLMNHAGLEKFNVELLNDDFSAEHFKGLVEEAIATKDNFVKITQNYHDESLEKLNNLSMLAKAL
jgi:polysaccharide pyruvyl transferase WcaK-like protein